MEVPVFASEEEKDEFYTLIGVAWEIYKMRTSTQIIDSFANNKCPVYNDITHNYCGRVLFKNTGTCWVHCNNRHLYKKNGLYTQLYGK